MVVGLKKVDTDVTFGQRNVVCLRSVQDLEGDRMMNKITHDRVVRMMLELSVLIVHLATQIKECWRSQVVRVC